MRNKRELSDLMPRIKLDIDRDRIRSIVDEALRMTEDYLGNYNRDRKDIMEDLDKFLNINIISTNFFINVGTTSIPDLKFRIDPRRRKILGISRFKKKVAQLNHLLRNL